MGLDIQVCVEYQIEKDGKMVWINGDHWRVNPYYEDEEDSRYELLPCFDTRDSQLFALLSNVNNYHNANSLGFDRGLPKDTTPETLEWLRSFGDCAKAPSWATLAELKQVASTHPTIRRYGFAKKEEHQRYLEQGICPSSLSRQVANESDYVYMEIDCPNHSLFELTDSIEARKKELFYLANKSGGESFDQRIRIVFFYDH